MRLRIVVSTRSRRDCGIRTSGASCHHFGRLAGLEEVEEVEGVVETNDDDVEEDGNERLLLLA